MGVKKMRLEFYPDKTGDRVMVRGESCGVIGYAFTKDVLTDKQIDRLKGGQTAFNIAVDSLDYWKNIKPLESALKK